MVKDEEKFTKEGNSMALYYGYDGIPKEWLSAIQRREWLKELCRME